MATPPPFKDLGGSFLFPLLLKSNGQTHPLHWTANLSNLDSPSLNGMHWVQMKVENLSLAVSTNPQWEELKNNTIWIGSSQKPNGSYLNQCMTPAAWGLSVVTRPEPPRVNSGPQPYHTPYYSLTIEHIDAPTLRLTHLFLVRFEKTPMSVTRVFDSWSSLEKEYSGLAND